MKDSPAVASSAAVYAGSFMTVFSPEHIFNALGILLATLGFIYTIYNSRKQRQEQRRHNLAIEAAMINKNIETIILESPEKE